MLDKKMFTLKLLLTRWNRQDGEERICIDSTETWLNFCCDVSKFIITTAEDTIVRNWGCWEIKEQSKCMGKGSIVSVGWFISHLPLFNPTFSRVYTMVISQPVSIDIWLNVSGWTYFKWNATVISNDNFNRLGVLLQMATWITASDISFPKLNNKYITGNGEHAYFHPVVGDRKRGSRLRNNL